MARRIQKQLLPQQLPEIKGLDCYGVSQPCFEVAGDYYDIITMNDGNTVFVIADVSGKGAGSALIMANLQASIRLGIHLSDSLSDFVSRVNDLIYSNTSDSEFVTFFMGIWVPAENALYYVNAGQNPPIILKHSGEILMLDATGLILGILKAEKYETKKINLEKGDLALIYTDGLEEALNRNDELFGTERIVNSLKINKNISPSDIIKNLLNETNEFTDGDPLHDDVTLIVLKRTDD
jgi:sigma-B regulation protein RsbU (phosphoserine phosphatase)